MPMYAARLRTPSGAVVKKGHSLLILYEGSVGQTSLKFHTRYGDRGFGCKTSIDLCIDVRGPEDDLESAMRTFSDVAQGAISIVCLGSNAPVEQPPVLELAYDVTPELDEHEYFQRQLSDPPAQIMQGRRVDPASLTKLFKVLGHHPEVDRLMRATVQYNIALSYWQPGRELLALNHLWIAGEALTPVAQRRELDRQGVDEAGLYERWQIGPRDERQSNWKGKLAAEVRRRVLFQGDDECYRLAKEASDGFEHGYMSFPELHDRAGQSRDRTAAYIRYAIFDLAGIEGELLDALLRPPFDKPLERWKLDFQLWGKLSGRVEDLAPEGHEHPSMEWPASAVTVTLIGDEKYNFKFKEQMTARLGDRATLTLERHEVHGPLKDRDREE